MAHFVGLDVSVKETSVALWTIPARCCASRRCRASQMT
jgi:hypothetical protein